MMRLVCVTRCDWCSEWALRVASMPAGPDLHCCERDDGTLISGDLLWVGLLPEGWQIAELGQYQFCCEECKEQWISSRK